MTLGKVEALLRLARDPHAAEGERRNALAAARKLAAKADESNVHNARPRPPPGRVEPRGGVECWVGDPPMHAAVCRQGSNGCPDCARVLAFRMWLRGQAK